MKAVDLIKVAQDVGLDVRIHPRGGMLATGRDGQVSVIWNDGSYSGRSPQSDTVEIWITGRTDVEGWVPVEKVATLLRGLAGALPATPCKEDAR